MNKRLNKNQLRRLYGSTYISKYHTEDKIRIKRLFNFININKSDIILDVGCGNGLLLDHTHNQIKFYYGVDFSKDFIKLAKTRTQKMEIENAEFICEDVCVFCKQFKNYFDKIFALDFAEHIYDNDFIKILSSMYKSLKCNGELYIHTPNGKYLVEVIKKQNILLKQFPEHIAVRTAIQYKKLLEKIGFRNIRIIYLPHYLKILSIFDSLKYIPLIGDYFKARLFIICKK